MADLWNYPTNVTNFVDVIAEANNLTGDMVSVAILLGVAFISFIITANFKNPAKSLTYSVYVTFVIATLMTIGGLLDIQWAVATWLLTAVVLFILHMGTKDVEL